MLHEPSIGPGEIPLTRTPFGPQLQSEHLQEHVHARLGCTDVGLEAQRPHRLRSGDCDQAGPGAAKIGIAGLEDVEGTHQSMIASKLLVDMPSTGA